MVQSLPKIRMPIDPFQVLDQLAPVLPPSLSDKEIIALDYDKEADVLYVSFVVNPVAVDSEALDEKGLVIAGLNEREDIIRLTILKASTFLYQN